jgi:hypothetical protein
MSTVAATRSELLARRSREGVAQRGHALLTQRRAALISELRRMGLEAGRKRAELEQTAAAARRALAQAKATDGPQAVASAAVAASPGHRGGLGGSGGGRRGWSSRRCSSRSGRFEKRSPHNGQVAIW